MRSARLLALVAVLLAVGAPALAHGLLVQARADGGAIVGRVYYSDGTAGAGEFVQLRDLSEPSRPPVGASTDGQGGFRFVAATGHRYAVVAHGEEGHTTEVTLTAAAGERARLTEPSTPSAEADAPPAWLIIGGLLLLSLPVAWWLNRRRAPATPVVRRP